MRSKLLALLAVGVTLPLGAAPVKPDRSYERLDRALVVVPASDGGNHVSWRLLATDRPGTAFRLLRDGRAIAGGRTC